MYSDWLTTEQVHADWLIDCQVYYINCLRISKFKKPNVRHKEKLKGQKLRICKMIRKLSQNRRAVRERDFRFRRRSERRFNQPLRKFIEHKYTGIYAEYVQLFNIMKAKHPNKRDLSTSSTFSEWKASNPPVEIVSSSAQQECTNIIDTAFQEALNGYIDTAELSFLPELNPCENLQPEQNPDENIEHSPTESLQNPDENIEHSPSASLQNPDENIEHSPTESLQNPDENIEHSPPASLQNPDENIEHSPTESLQNPDENIEHSPPALQQNFGEVDDIINEILENEHIRNILERPEEDEGIGLNVFDEIEFDIEPFDFAAEVEPYDF